MSQSTSKPRKKKPAPAQEKLDAVGIDTICEHIADCESLRVIAARYGVSQGRLVVWLAKHPEQYMRAREAQAERHAEEILEIADTIRLGERVTTKANGDVETVTMDMVERARLQIEARKWLAGKMKPKMFGEKIAVSGDEAGAPIQVATKVDLSPTMDAIEAKLASLINKTN